MVYMNSPFPHPQTQTCYLCFCGRGALHKCLNNTLESALLCKEAEPERTFDLYTSEHNRIRFELATQNRARLGSLGYNRRAEVADGVVGGADCSYRDLKVAVSEKMTQLWHHND